MDEKALAIPMVNEIIAEKVVFGNYGAEITTALTPDEWCKAVEAVGKVNSMTQFYLGDLVVYAESPVTGWGEKYTDLVELTGYEYESLKQYATVARQFPREFRELVYAHTPANISWGHFQKAQGLDLDTAKHFLTTAGEAGWSTRRLAEEVAKYKAGGRLEDVGEEEPIGYKSFKQQMKNQFKNYMPQRPDEEYDEVAWLTEIRDWAEARLEELGVI